MTEAKALDLIEEWRQRLIPEWRIEVSEEPFDGAEPDEVWGQCDVAEDRLRASIYLSPDTLLSDDKHVELVIVHELLHVILEPLQRQVGELSMEAGIRRSDDIRSDCTRNLEQAIERLSLALTGLGVGQTVKA